MRVYAILSATVVLSSVGLVAADDALVIRDYRPNCWGRITEITKVPATMPMGMPAPMLGDTTRIPKGVPMQLDSREWQGNKNFTDQSGRRWCLAAPGALRQCPQNLAGVLYRAPQGQAFFMTIDHMLFVELPKP